jgi:predicted ATP-dependent serine protease
VSLSPNRENKRASKLGKFWCYSCDASRVSEYGKCPNCGARAGTGRAWNTPKLEIDAPPATPSSPEAER